MTDTSPKAIGNCPIFYRNNQVLWRSNDDETVLLLNSTTGNAYLLCPAMTRIWMALANGIPEVQVNQFGLTCGESFMAAINDLKEKELITLVAEESACLESGTLLKGLSGPYTIDEIAFGGCDCTPGMYNRRGNRTYECNQAGTWRRNISVV